jgi:hypothetical protein
VTAKALLSLAGALIALACPAAAQADGDPASDVLLSQDVFHPYAPNATSAPLRRALDGMVATSRRRGFPVKVALIATTSDLGAYPYLLAEPQRYADLLAVELTSKGRPRVLTVLPGGLGARNLAGATKAALAGPPPGGGGGDRLAQAAMLALGRASAAAGHPVPVPAVARTPLKCAGSGGGGGGTSLLLAFGVPTLLAVGAAAFASRRARRRG